MLPPPLEDAVNAEKFCQYLQKMFGDLRYIWFRVAKTQRDEYNGLQEIQAIEIHSDRRRCDYVAVPEETREEIRSKTN